MTQAARTVFYFGMYLLIEGLFLMVAPSRVLSAIGLPDPESVWRVIVGFIVVVLGYYYIRNARENLIPFFGFTVHIRLIQLLFFIGLYIQGVGTWVLVGFSSIECMAGVWTWLALKKHRQ